MSELDSNVFQPLDGMLVCVLTVMAILLHERPLVFDVCHNSKTLFSDKD